MAYLNHHRNVNDEWTIHQHADQCTRNFELDIVCASFRLNIRVGYWERDLYQPPTQVQLIALAEYLWQPGKQVCLSLDHAIQTIKYLEVTRG